MKRALVTGVTRGLGAYLAARLLEEGWSVVGVGRRSGGEVQAAANLQYVQADLSRPDCLDGLADRIGGCPDLIIHNAVSYPPTATDTDGKALAEMESAFRVNALVPYLLTRDLLLNHRLSDEFVSCVVINSDAVYHADDGSAAYAASKAALRVFTTALASTCRGHNVSVSTLLLGPLADDGKVAQLKRIARQRSLTPGEATALFLRRSNPELVITELIDFESCYRSVGYLAGLGPVANGMLCRLDGGSAGSLL